MTDKTRRELVNQACAYLGLKPGGQAANGIDYAAVDGYVMAVIEQLEGEAIYRVDDPDAIAPAAFLPLATYLAAAAAPEFGVPEIDTTKARAALYRLAAADPTGLPQIATYY